MQTYSHTPLVILRLLHHLKPNISPSIDTKTLKYFSLNNIAMRINISQKLNNQERSFQNTRIRTFKNLSFIKPGKSCYNEIYISFMCTNYILTAIYSTEFSPPKTVFICQHTVDPFPYLTPPSPLFLYGNKILFSVFEVCVWFVYLFNMPHTNKMIWYFSV